ncbi:MAG: Na+/H+ antiporter NhaA, partial [Ilumatobacteraceae bacterium]
MTAPQISSAQPTFLQSDRALARVVRPFVRFSHIEAAGGIVLIAGTLVALVWANSPWKAGYESLWSTNLRFELGSYVFDEDLTHVVNDLLMAVFFFVVGMEIKRELVTGELRDRRAVALPAMAALGGMIVPAAIFLVFNAGGDASHGWGIPMATDIAFALGVVALLGSRVPPAVKVLLLTLAIVDDIGAIVVIALFYTERVHLKYALAALVIAVVVAGMHKARIVYPPLILIAGCALWLAVYESGIHATIAGVIMGLLTPARPTQSQLEANELVGVLEDNDDIRADEVRVTARLIRGSVSACDRLIDTFHPWTSYLIVPVF